MPIMETIGALCTTIVGKILLAVLVYVAGKFIIRCNPCHDRQIASGTFSPDGDPRCVIPISVRICLQKTNGCLHILQCSRKRLLLGQPIVHRGAGIPMIPEIIDHQFRLPALAVVGDEPTPMNQHEQLRVLHSGGQICDQCAARLLRRRYAPGTESGGLGPCGRKSLRG